MPRVAKPLSDVHVRKLSFAVTAAGKPKAALHPRMRSSLLAISDNEFFSNLFHGWRWVLTYAGDLAPYA